MDLVNQLRLSSDSFDKLMTIIENNSEAISAFDLKHTCSIKLSANEMGVDKVSTTVNVTTTLLSAGVTNSDEAYVTNILANIGGKYYDASTFFAWETEGPNTAKLVRIYQNNLLDASYFTDGQKAGTDNVSLILFIKVLKH